MDIWWLVAAYVAGAATSLVLSALLQVSGYLPPRTESPDDPDR